jgi:hypothetical protein
VVCPAQGTQTETRIPTHWSVIACGMTASPPVVSPNSILLPLSSHVVVTSRKNSALLSNSLVYFLTHLKLHVRNCVNLKLLLSGSVCTTRNDITIAFSYLPTLHPLQQMKGDLN